MAAASPLLPHHHHHHNPLLQHHHPRHARRPPVELCGIAVRVPRTSALVRVLACLIALLVFVQAVSCGLFFCVAVPFGHHRASAYVDVRDIVSDAPMLQEQQLQQLQAHLHAAGAGAGGLRAAGAVALLSTPKLIPRIVHQTHRTKRFPRAARPLVASWRAANGDGWEVRFYDAAAAANFVRREFPEYVEAYLALPKDVERADFFK